jgi:hypothetical protein
VHDSAFQTSFCLLNKPGTVEFDLVIFSMALLKFNFVVDVGLFGLLLS